MLITLKPTINIDMVCLYIKSDGFTCHTVKCAENSLRYLKLSSLLIYTISISIEGLNLGVLVNNYNHYILKWSLWNFLYKEKVVMGEILEYKSL